MCTIFKVRFLEPNVVKIQMVENSVFRILFVNNAKFYTLLHQANGLFYQLIKRDLTLLLIAILSGSEKIYQVCISVFEMLLLSRATRNMHSSYFTSVNTEISK